MTRIRFKGFSRNRLSQTGLLAKTGHPSDVIEETADAASCQAATDKAASKWADSPKPSLSGRRTSRV